jgi:chromosome segregation ATPase
MVGQAACIEICRHDSTFHHCKLKGANMPVTQVTQSNIAVFKTPCNIDLTALSGAKLNHPDPAIREQASNLINQAFSIQAEVDAMTERLKVETLSELEDRHVGLLLEKERLESELKTLGLRRYEFDNETARINGRLHKAQVDLDTHHSTKKQMNPMFTLPATKHAWQEKESGLIAAVEAVRQDQRELSGMIAEWNEEAASAAYRVRVKVAEIEVIYNRLEKVRGNPSGRDRATGLPT